jgi:hypothetical protein
VTASTISYAVWALIGAAVVALVLVSVPRPAAVARPSRVMERLATQPVLRVVLLLGYMWLGWHLFAR